MTADDEEWRDIFEYEGLYQVSSHGRVRSLPRPFCVGRVLKPLYTMNGYNQVSLSKNGVMRRFTIHGLVAEEFIGERPEGYHVCHGDGDKDNNHVSNLRYDTRENNELQKIEHGTRIRGKDSHYAVLTEDEVYEIRELAAKREVSQDVIAAKYGVCRGTISLIHARTTWAHLPERVYK